MLPTQEDILHYIHNTIHINCSNIMPHSRLEISVRDPTIPSFGTSQDKKRSTAEKTPIPADSPLFSQVR